MYSEGEMKIEYVDERYVIYGMLFSLCNRIQTIGDKEFEDITLKQHFFLASLELFVDSPSLREMGELIGCSYQNVKRMAQHLQKAGYLNIVQDKEDRRKLLLISTEKMHKLAKQKREKSLRFMENLYKNISDDELKMTLLTLKKMNKNIGGVIK